MIRTLDHLVITTEKLDACLAFYQALGFTAHSGGGRWELFAGDLKLNVHLRGRELSPHAGAVQPGSADFCLEVDDDLETLRRSLLDRGLAVELGVVNRTGVHGPMRSLYLRDPDGNLVELCSYAE